MSVRLAVETAGDSVGVALARGDEIMTSSWVTTRAASSELVMAMVADALDQTNTEREAITELVGCRGPGSFTGIRVGLATLRGLALSLSVSLRTLTAFEVEVAGGSEGKRPVFVALDARRGQLYAQYFPAVDGAEATRAGGEPVIVDPTPAALRAQCSETAIDLVGSGPTRYPEIFAESFPDATVITGSRARVESLALAAGWGWGRDIASPFYLRPPDAKLPRKGISG